MLAYLNCCTYFLSVVAFTFVGGLAADSNLLVLSVASGWLLLLRIIAYASPAMAVHQSKRSQGLLISADRQLFQA